MNTVYLLTSPSGKHYVGITSKTPEERWKKHCRDAQKGSQRALQQAIRKHGPESFKVETIETVETWEEACEREKFWIAWIGTRPPFGYNLTGGGDGVVGVKASDETKAKMSAAQKGRKGNWLGKSHTAETKAKVSSARKGRAHSEETRTKISVSCKAAHRASRASTNPLTSLQDVLEFVYDH